MNNSKDGTPTTRLSIKNKIGSRGSKKPAGSSSNVYDEENAPNLIAKGHGPGKSGGETGAQAMRDNWGPGKGKRGSVTPKVGNRRQLKIKSASID